MKKILIFTVMAVAGMVSMRGYAENSSAGNKEEKTYVTVKTSEGDFTLWLYDDTPLHRDNFIRLCKEGKYDGVLFHRVIKDFLIQGGDPESRKREADKVYGDGDGGFCINAEIKPEHFCKKGALIDAKLGDDVNPTRMSAGTHFCVVQGKRFTDEQLDKTEKRMNEWQQNYLYHKSRYDLMLEKPELAKVENGDILNAEARKRAKEIYEKEGTIKISPERREIYKTIGGTPHLDGTVTVFGELVDGQETVERITLMDTDKSDRPVVDVVILSTEVWKK